MNAYTRIDGAPNLPQDRVQSDLGQNNFTLISPADIGIDPSLCAIFTAAIAPSLTPEPIGDDQALARNRGMAQAYITPDRIIPVNGKMSASGLECYGYALPGNLNPEYSGINRYYKGINTLNDGEGFWSYKAMQSLAAIARNMYPNTPLVQLSVHIINYICIHGYYGKVTPPQIHRDGLPPHGLTGIITLARQNVIGGKFAVADGDQVGKTIDETPTRSLHFLGEVPVGHGLLISEADRPDGALGHTATDTLLAPNASRGNRMIAAFDLIPIAP